MEALCRAFPRGQNLQPISSSDHFPARNRLQPQSVRIQASSGRISVFGQMGAGAGEGQMPALVVPEGVQTQSCFVPSRTPELPRALEPSLRLRAARLRRPTAPPLLALSRPPKSPFALGAPLDSAPAWATVSRAELLSSRSKTGRPSFNPSPLHSVEGPASALAHLPQRRQAAAVHALPRLPTAPSTSRSVWSAPACWRCRTTPLRPETYDSTSAFHKRPDGLLTRLHCPFEGRISPRPDGNDSIGGPGSSRA